MIIVVALGARTTGGYGILIDGASESANGGVAVIIDSNSPASDCFVTHALTQPVDIARVSVRDGRVSFVEQSHETKCG